MTTILGHSLSLFIISWITANRQLIHDKTASRTQWNQSYDFIIVGAGAAGCVVANRLAQNQKITVLLLEAGGAQDAFYNDIPGLWSQIFSKRLDLQWNYDMVPQKFSSNNLKGRARQILGKTLGGSSTHNNMFFSRGNPKDYDLWERDFGAKGWGFRDVLPFFKRFERNLDKSILAVSPGYHGTNGPVDISSPREVGENLLELKQALNSLGFMDTDINGANQTGTMIGQSFVSVDRFRSSSSNAYVDPNPYPKNLHILTKSLVTKILFNGLTAVGVEFAKNNKMFKVYAQKEVIISAGAVNSAQLLMLSGVGPKQHLQQFGIPVLINLPVGNNFKNHPAISLNSGFKPSLNSENLSKLYYEKSGPLSHYNFIALFLSTKSNSDKEWPNVFMFGVNGTQNNIYLDAFLVKIKSTGTIRLQSTSPYVQPLIDPNFYSDPLDYTSGIEMSSELLRIASHPSSAVNPPKSLFKDEDCPTCQGLKDYECRAGIECYFKRNTGPAAHPCCTCRMGATNRDDIVVDPWLRVKNARQLRVCDNSIMPDIPNGNLYSPALMIGEKCAQLIKDNYNL